MNVKKVLKLENKILKVKHKTELVKNDVYSTVHIILGGRYRDDRVGILDLFIGHFRLCHCVLRKYWPHDEF